MKISFLITYYNQKEFVERSLMSILNQNLTYDYEILVGDDGSSDGTVEDIQKIIDKFPDKIKLFQMTRDSNFMIKSIHRAAANRINLLKHAAGEYFCVLDGDDYYNNLNFADKGINILEKNKKLSGCAFDFEIVYSDRKELFNTGITKKSVVTAHKYVKQNYIHAGAIVFRNIFTPKLINIVENSKNFDDNLITIFMLQFGDLYYTGESAYSYTQSENSLWNSFSSAEQNLLNAMDYEIISKTAAKFKNALFCRQFPAIKYIYKNRTKLKELLGDAAWENYVQENSELNNKIILLLLNWNNISMLKKCQIKFWYRFNKLFHTS